MVADLLCFLSGDRGRVLKERGTFSLMTFGTFGHAKVREKKSIFMFLRVVDGADPYNIKSKCSQ